MEPNRDDSELVEAAQRGDADAFGVLFDRWFDRVWDVAWRIVRDREVAADVAQDVFLVAWQRLDTLQQPASFGGWLLRASRNRALNRLERERRSTPAGGSEAPVMAGLPADRDDPTQDLEERSRDELVWAASAALGERDASVLDLHLRHGLAPGEIAEALDVTPNHAHQLLFRLKDRLGAAIRSWVLWRRGSPRCTDLAAALAGADITAFGADAVRVIGRHAGGCEACTADRDEVLAPDRLFAAVPIALAPPALKARAAGALEADGVPTPGEMEPDLARIRAPGRGAAGRRPRTGALLLGAAALIVVVVALVVALANRTGDEDDVATVGTDAPTTATSGRSETTTTSTTAPPTTVAPA
ncbi:MAG TPA: sigma-70 family RNA polymerase sigma factor, partial [Acidimicrobiales bacterium]|nr:sigma-70 family RNA polymerase sigma factor [Acidimicrobiales bacterium]